MILARIIAPEDYGLYAIAYIFMVTASIIKEFGVNNYLTKEKHLSKDIIRSAYGTNLLIAGLASLALFAAATPIAHFYQQPALKPLLQIMCLPILFAPFGSIIDCLLRREMQFKPALIAGLASQLVSVSTMIYLALHDFGVYALAYGSVVQSFCLAVFMQFFRPKDLPHLPSLKHSKTILRYASFVGIYRLSNHVSTYLSELLAGKYFTLALTGQLNRAVSTVSIFNKVYTEALTPVLMPYIALLNRTEQDISAKLRQLTQINLSLAWPFFMMLGLCAEPVVLVLFGNTWLTAAYILQVLCVSRVIFCMSQTIEPVLLGMGLAKPLMNIGLICNGLRIALALWFVQYGLMEMILAAGLITPSVRIFLTLFVLRQHMQIGFREYSSWFRQPGILTLSTLLPPLCCFAYFGTTWWQHYYLAGIAVTCSGVVWLIILTKQGVAAPILNKLPIKFLTRH